VTLTLDVGVWVLRIALLNKTFATVISKPFDGLVIDRTRKCSGRKDGRTVGQLLLKRRRETKTNHKKNNFRQKQLNIHKCIFIRNDNVIYKQKRINKAVLESLVGINK
jgi:hypothetical protein